MAITAKAADGFRTQPRRWVVERTFAWAVGYCRLQMEHECHPETSEAVIQAAMIDLRLHRLHPEP